MCVRYTKNPEENDLKVELYSVSQSTDLVIDNEKKTVTFSVSGDEEKFSLSNISFRNNSEIVFLAYSDKDLSEEIENEVTLSAGENIFYIVAWHKDAPSEKVTYTVTATKPAEHVHSFGEWTVVTHIGSAHEYAIAEIYYEGNESGWNTITGAIAFGENSTIYYYSESQPAQTGNYWHYVGQSVVKW